MSDWFYVISSNPPSHRGAKLWQVAGPWGFVNWFPRNFSLGVEVRLWKPGFRLRVWNLHVNVNCHE